MMTIVSRGVLLGISSLAPVVAGAATNSVAYLALTQTVVLPVEFKQVGAGHFFVDFGRAALSL